MKKTLALLMVLFLSTGLACAQAGGFLHGFEDLPLAPGLEEVPDSGMSFDTLQGRILDGYATGDTDAAAVLAFYEDTLPQLGWTPLGKGLYRREGEQLTIEILPGKRFTVRYSIKPQ